VNGNLEFDSDQEFGCKIANIANRRVTFLGTRISVRLTLGLSLKLTWFVQVRSQTESTENLLAKFVENELGLACATVPPTSFRRAHELESLDNLFAV
jgi:hypothetical protein